MIAKKPMVSTLALAIALAGGAAGLNALSTERAAAQATTTAQQTPEPQHHRFDPSRHIEGRIAYLKAELKITDAQSPQFERLAQAMRDNAKEMAQAFAQRHANRDQPQTAVDRLEARARFGAMRVEHTQRLLAAFKPLYDTLSDDQKKTADELLAGHHWRHR